MKRILITGGQGILGVALIPKLLEKNWTVLALGRSRPTISHPHFQWQETDLARATEFPCESQDIVLHMANLSRESISDDRRVAHALAKKSLAAGVSKFFFTSSVRVYGVRYGTVDESAVPRPARDDSYGENKLFIEKDLENIFRSSPSHFIALRVGHLVSKTHPEKNPNISNRFLWFRGRSSPHFINVLDAANAICFLLDADRELKSSVFNITRELHAPQSYHQFFSPSGPVMAKFFVRRFSLPRAVGFLAARKRVSAHGQGAMNILENSLAEEGFRFEG